MKKIIATALTLGMVVGSLAACTSTPTPTEATKDTEATTESKETTEASQLTDAEEDNILNVMSFTVEVPDMIKAYFKAHPEVSEKYEIKDTVVATDGGGYQTALDAALAAGGADAPDIYCAEDAFVAKYSKGDAAQFAAPYAALGIDVDKEVADAKIANYTVELGTRPDDGALVALAYQATGCAMIYRRDIAKDVFGTDDPAAIAAECGPGMDKFFAAADKCKAKGYAMISSVGDLWNMCKANTEVKAGWVVDDTLNIDPQREAFLDYAKTIIDKGYSNDTGTWSEAWYADMAGSGDKQVFCFLGPAWLINYVMAGNSGSWKETGETDADGNPVKELDTSIGTYGKWAVCDSPLGFFWGGSYVLANKDTDKATLVGDIIRYITLDTSENGLQYAWANGLLSDDGTKDTVASAVVMDKSDGKVDFLAGQNMFDVFGPAGDFATGKLATPYDEDINRLFNDQVTAYSHGEKDRDAAIADFKTNVAEQVGINVG
ncbi:MAG: extracellular solute-binding protein [Clostridiales bacterium]|nr:extracellular solute-binding protein [Clostridiales bacterium]